MATNALRMAKLTKYLKTFKETFENWNHDKLDQGAIRLTFLAHDRVPGGFPKLLELAQNSIPRDFNGYVSGTIASVVQLANGLVNGMAWGVGVSVVVMWLVCAVLFRSWRLAAIAFFPNAFPIIVVYGYMGLVGSPLKQRLGDGRHRFAGHEPDDLHYDALPPHDARPKVTTPPLRFAKRSSTLAGRWC